MFHCTQYVRTHNVCVRYTVHLHKCFIWNRRKRNNKETYNRSIIDYNQKNVFHIHSIACINDRTYIRLHESSILYTLLDKLKNYVMYHIMQSMIWTRLSLPFYVQQQIFWFFFFYSVFLIISLIAFLQCIYFCLPRPLSSKNVLNFSPHKRVDASRPPPPPNGVYKTEENTFFFRFPFYTRICVGQYKYIHYIGRFILLSQIPIIFYLK